MNEKIREEYSVKIYEIDPYFYDHYKEKIKVDINELEYNYLELVSILLNVFQPQKLMNKTMKTENLVLKKKDKRHQKKNLVAHLLELLKVMQKRVMIQTMNLAKYKCLSANLKKKK